MPYPDSDSCSTSLDSCRPVSFCAATLVERATAAVPPPSAITTPPGTSATAVKGAFRRSASRKSGLNPYGNGLSATGKPKPYCKVFPGRNGSISSERDAKVAKLLMNTISKVDPPLPIVLFKTLHHFAPGFLPALSHIPDPRDPRFTVYPIEEMFLVGILLFILLPGARRNIKYKLGTPKFIENMLRIAEVFYPKRRFLFPDDRLLNGDTLNKLLKRIPEEYSHQLRVLLVRALIRGRCWKNGGFWVAMRLP